MDMGTEHDTRTSPHSRKRGRIARACLLGLVALGLIALGAAGATLALRHTTGTGLPAAPMATVSAPTPAESVGEAEVALSPEGLARAGIKTAPVAVVSAGATVTVPGTVTANSYREVKVTPIAPGIVTKVHVELGASVRRGAPLLTLFSPELADSQTKYMSMSALFEADHNKLERTRKLVEIGAASRQDLEEITAIHEAHATEVEAARQRLQLLGLRAEQVRTLTSPSQVVSTIVVPAPIAGVITSRSANLGQVVAMGQELLSVTDLSEVWVVGDLYEQDFKTVRVGSEAAITTPAYPGLTLRGRVSYIDPRVDPQARTAKARIEVSNADGRLRLGMYVSVSFTTPGASTVVVPRSAVQAIGDRQVVFVPARNEEGKFIQRQVRLGSPIGDNYSVLSGLKLGETVVTEGSFFLRAEVLRNAPGG
jgi:RND family efflux transporter MFP subunit